MSEVNLGPPSLLFVLVKPGFYWKTNFDRITTTFMLHEIQFAARFEF
jgi:cyclophilin family peptidyl-prolyl cis-trans isomerase